MAHFAEVKLFLFMSASQLDTRLTRLMEANQRTRDPIREPRNTLPILPELQRWQAARLRETFTDFLASPRERPAAEFFLTDLYGDFDVSGRDANIERVLPVMRRVLPGRLLGAATDAIELSVLSHALDLRVAAELDEMGVTTIDTVIYGVAYRNTRLRRLRRRQIELVRTIGESLDRTVTQPMVGSLLRMSRMPAKAAGLSELQSFLERGFAAFRALGGSRAFVNSIADRELRVSERLFSGHPEPFAID